MGILILAGLLLIAFAAYRVYVYKKQRQIEEMAADAQAYVSSEIVEILQKLKSLIARHGGVASPDIQIIQNLVKNQLENLNCHTDSEASVKEYLSAAKQELAILKVKLQKIEQGESLNSDEHHSPMHNQSGVPTEIENQFDALK